MRNHDRSSSVRRTALLAAIASLGFGSAVVLAADPVPTPALTPTTAPAAQSAEAMQDAINAVKLPALDQTRRADQTYINEFVAATRVAQVEQANLKLAFVKAYPTDPAAAASAASIVSTLAAAGRPVGPAVEELLALPLPDDTKFAVRLMETQAAANRSDADLDAVFAKLDALKAERPKDDRVAQVMGNLARRLPGDAGIARMRTIVADYPGSAAAKSAAGAIRRADGVGQPFALAFNEAVTGKPIDLQTDLKGKVVVLDFWATWCGPCIAEMPHMKELYAQFKDKGVEFIGVSLDQPEDKGGKAKLLAYVAENGVTWPQYYQGNYWASEFSQSWGINSIPALFVVDADGKLASVNGRGKLEELLPALIAKRDAK